MSWNRIPKAFSGLTSFPTRPGCVSMSVSVTRPRASEEPPQVDCSFLSGNQRALASTEVKTKTMIVDVNERDTGREKQKRSSE